MASTQHAPNSEVSFAVVTAVRKLPGVHRTFDIEVSNRHRFFANDLLVHNCIGKYHPHGDGSVDGAIETLVQHPTPTMLGSGNWGGLLDSAAAMRYTNCKLSSYGESFFLPDYINSSVTSFVPNYDGEDDEPVSLPSMLPNVLLNGGEGIGVGVTTLIPTFSPESIIIMLKRVLAGETLTPVDYAKTLKFQSKWGGHVLNTKENRAAWLQLFKTGSASVQFKAALHIDRNGKAIEIDDWPPGLNPVALVDKIRPKEMKNGKVRAGLAEVDQVFNHNGDTGFRIEMKKDRNYTQFDELVKKIERLTTSRKSFKINVTYRKATVEDGKVIFNTRFLSVSIPKLLSLWLKERLQIEKRSLEYRLKNQAAMIAYSKLLIYASTKLEVVFAALKSQDSKAYLVTNLKLTPEQADTILELRVRQLSKLDKAAMESKLKEQVAFEAQLQKWYKAPRAKVSADMDTCLLAIQKDRTYENVKEEELTIA